MPRRINVDIGSVAEREAKKERAELLRVKYAKEQRGRIQAMRDAEKAAVEEDKRVEMLEKEKEKQAAMFYAKHVTHRPLGEELKAAVAEKTRRMELQKTREQALRDQELMKKEMIARKARKGGKKRKTKRKTKRKSRRKSRKNKKRKSRRTKRSR